MRSRSFSSRWHRSARPHLRRWRRWQRGGLRFLLRRHGRRRLSPRGSARRGCSAQVSGSHGRWRRSVARAPGWSGTAPRSESSRPCPHCSSQIRRYRARGVRSRPRSVSRCGNTGPQATMGGGCSAATARFRRRAVVAARVAGAAHGTAASAGASLRPLGCCVRHVESIDRPSPGGATFGRCATPSSSPYVPSPAPPNPCSCPMPRRPTRGPAEGRAAPGRCAWAGAAWPSMPGGRWTPGRPTRGRWTRARTGRWWSMRGAMGARRMWKAMLGRRTPGRRTRARWTCRPWAASTADAPNARPGLPGVADRALCWALMRATAGRAGRSVPSAPTQPAWLAGAAYARRRAPLASPTATAYRATAARPAWKLMRATAGRAGMLALPVGAAGGSAESLAASPPAASCSASDYAVTSSVPRVTTVLAGGVTSAAGVVTVADRTPGLSITAAASAVR